MRYGQVEKQCALAPLLLGLLALAISALSAALRFPLGAFGAELLLFLGPLAFGFRGALSVIATGLVPWVYNTGDIETGTRLSILLMAVAAGQRFLPIVPGYVTTLLAWLACVSPTLSSFQAFHAREQSILAEPVMMALTQDVLVAALAGCLLFNDAFWWKLTGRTRLLQPRGLIPHLMAATSLTAIFVVAVALRHAGLLESAIETQQGMGLGTVIVTGFVLIPTLFGIHIARAMASSQSPLLGAHGQSALEPGAQQQSNRMPHQDDSWEIMSGRTATPQTAARTPEERAAIDVGVCALDGDGAILFMNDNFRRLAGVAEGGSVGSQFELTGSTSSLCQYIWQLVSTTDPSQEHQEDLRVSGRADNVKFLQIHLCSHQLSERPEGANASDRPPRVIRISDITAKRTIDEKLSRIQRHKALSACAQAAAPQLSRLFTAILGRASYAKESGKQGAEVAALAQIEKLCAQGAPLVQQLNELGVAPDVAERHVVSLSASVEERLALLQGLVPEATFVLAPTQEAGGLLPVKLDSALLTQALSLVVMNAAEAYPGGKGKIAISLAKEEIDELVSKLHPGSRPGSFARISISDFGRGMPAEVLARAANPLLTVRGEYGHIGLDLPSVLAVMSEHDGFMTVESKQDRGTTVSLYFPLLPQAALAQPSKQEAAVPDAQHNHANTRVMIVEDSPELRDLLSDMVRSLGYQSVACESKDGAMQLLESNTVDILLVEDSLPGLEARELVNHAHASGHAIKTVLLAAAQNAAAEESDAVLVKPFSLQQLSKTLDESERGYETTPQAAKA